MKPVAASIRTLPKTSEINALTETAQGVGLETERLRGEARRVHRHRVDQHHADRVISR